MKLVWLFASDCESKERTEQPGILDGVERSLQRLRCLLSESFLDDDKDRNTPCDHDAFIENPLICIGLFHFFASQGRTGRFLVSTACTAVLPPSNSWGSS